MTLQEIRENIQKRELKVDEVLSASWTLMAHRFGQYFLLSVLVFMPVSLVMELFYSTIPVEADQVTMDQMTRMLILQLVLNLFSMISLCVTAHMVQSQLQKDEAEPFGGSFYRGIAQWPRFLATVVLVGLILGAALCSLMMIGMIMPLLLIPAMALVLIVIVLGIVLIYDVCIAASLRRYMLLPCFNYVRSIVQEHIGKSIGIILLLTVISTFAAYPVVATVNRFLLIMHNPVLTIIVNTVINTVVGIVNIYTNIGAVVYFMNLEMLKFRELGAIE